MSDVLPDGIRRDVGEQIATAVLQLYQPDQDDSQRYVATRHLLWQSMYAMVNNGVSDQVAVQTIVAALMEVLVDGLGPQGTAAHLRLMADELETGPRIRQ